MLFVVFAFPEESWSGFLLLLLLLLSLLLVVALHEGVHEIVEDAVDEASKVVVIVIIVGLLLVGGRLGLLLSEEGLALLPLLSLLIVVVTEAES